MELFLSVQDLDVFYFFKFMITFLSVLEPEDAVMLAAGGSTPSSNRHLNISGSHTCKLYPPKHPQSTSICFSADSLPFFCFSKLKNRNWMET